MERKIHAPSKERAYWVNFRQWKGGRVIWFTSDTHFGHDNIIRYCNRPFRSIEEMDRNIICRWNEVVKPDDTVYFLGDFCFGHPDKYTKQLNGKIFYINGSHDKNMRGRILSNDIACLDNAINDEYGNPRKIVICHYAMRSWPLSHYASWHLFGHHHGKLEPYGLSFDVGVDCWGYYPVSLDEVAHKMATLKPIIDYRKGG
jgi:calcineurin-like phosphoesterase family protein